MKDILPRHAQEIYKEAFNHATQEYKDSSKRRDKGESAEETAYKVAWAAVKQEYEKKDGEWVKK